SLAPLSATGVASGTPTSTTLSPGGNATYTVSAHALGAKSGKFTDASVEVIVDCTDPTPTKVTNPVISLVTPPAGDTFVRSPGLFSRADKLSLRATGSSTCFSPGSTSFSYFWTLAPVTPPTLNDAATQRPSFTVDTPGGTYTLTVVATDSIANASQPGTSSFTAENCGANPVNVTVTAAQLAGNLAFDPWTASATATSTDDDPTSCPTRFAQTYDFAWTVQPPLGATRFSFSPATGSS